MLEVRDLRRYFVVRHGLLARFRHPDHIIRAVDGVSFDIAGGEVFGIIGESGSGKTTLARTILRLCEPDAGFVRFLGRDLSTFDAEELRQYRRQVQPVFQDADSTLDPRQRTGSILEEPLLIHRIGNRQERRAQIANVLQQVNLSSAFMERHPSELSGGQRQRVALARALLLEPALLIADEPTSGLDPVVSTQILAMLLRLRKERALTLLLISHDLTTVLYAADRIAVMHRGRMVELCGGDHFLARAAHPYTRFLLGIERQLPEAGVLESMHEQSREAAGCLYARTCAYRRPLCLYEAPPLAQLSPDHLIACHAIR